MADTKPNRRLAWGALLAAGVLLLGACGGDDDDAKDKDKNKTDEQSETAGDESGPVIDPDAPEADSEFCQQAVDLMTMDVNPDAAGTEEAMKVAESLDPPEEIAEAWSTLISATRAVQDLDPEDPEAQQEAMAAYQDMADEQEKVVEYLQTQCGIDTGASDIEDTTSTTVG